MAEQPGLTPSQRATVARVHDALGLLAAPIAERAGRPAADGEEALARELGRELSRARQELQRVADGVGR